MPIFFFVVGLVLIVTGVNGTVKDAGALLKKDFTGPNNFFIWVFAILAVGAVGYIPKAKPLSYGFLTLVFIIILFKSGSGFFNQFRDVMAKLNAGQSLSQSSQSVEQSNPLLHFVDSGTGGDGGGQPDYEQLMQMFADNM